MTLASKLSEVMTAVGYIPKTGRNTAQNYDFVTDADVLDTLRTELAKRGIAVATSVNDVVTVPFVTAKGSPMFLVTVKGDVTFYDGENPDDTITVEGAGQGSDSTDKGIYKAITGMVKYALLKTFLVPTGDDPERDDAPTKSAGEGPARAAAGEAKGDAASPASGLTDKQRKLLFARVTAAGLKGRQAKGLLFTVVGKHESSQLNSEDLDKILTALENDAMVAQVRAEFEA